MLGTCEDDHPLPSIFGYRLIDQLHHPGIALFGMQVHVSVPVYIDGNGVHFPNVIVVIFAVEETVVHPVVFPNAVHGAVFLYKCLHDGIRIH